VKLLATSNIKYPGTNKGMDTELLHEIIPVKVRGYLSAGLHRLQFRVPLIERHNKELLESVRGDCIQVTYALEVELDRGILKRILKRRVEFLMHVPLSKQQIRRMDLEEPDPVPFLITPTSLGRNIKKGVFSVPNFLFRGKLHRKSIPLDDPITGDFLVEMCEVSIQSIDLQLMRVESLFSRQQNNLSNSSSIEFLTGSNSLGWNEYGNEYSHDRANNLVHRKVSEVQVSQIADGDVCRNLVIPIYMMLPKLWTCQTTISPLFKLEYELNLIVIFGDGYRVMQNFPLLLYRR